MTQIEYKPIGFRFINTVHPGDATSANCLSRIRSHAAKDIRARRRRARLAGSPPIKESEDSHCCDNPVGSHTVEASPQTTRTMHGTANMDGGAPIRCQSAISNILNEPWLLRRDPHLTPARNLSADEVFLLDHYIDHILIFRKGKCREGSSDATSWFKSMQVKCWLPFALADMGLLTTLLLQSCRSMETLSQSQNFSHMYTTYKHQCIRATNDSLSHANTRINDITIAMVMILVGESYVLGNFQEWDIHLRAFTDMISMRGGLNALGLDGFLQQVVIKSPDIYGHWETLPGQINIQC